MNLESNQGNNATNTFLERFEQWELECQQKYLNDIKLVLGNSEAKKIFLDLKSYVYSYKKVVHEKKLASGGLQTVSENILINKPINEISENEIPIDDLFKKKVCFYW